MDKMLKMLPNETEFWGTLCYIDEGRQSRRGHWRVREQKAGAVSQGTGGTCVSFAKSSSCSSAMITRGQHGPSFCSFSGGQVGVEG